MFIKLTAAFQSDDQPDFEGMGIKAAQEDFTNCMWDDFYVPYDKIVGVYVNSAGYTNVELVGGFTWCVKETPEDIKMLCNVERYVEYSQQYASTHPEIE